MHYLLLRLRIVRALTFILLGATGLFSQGSLAQGDGPRAYQLVPEGAQVLSQFYFDMQGNDTPSAGQVVEGADIDINLGVTQYAGTLDVGGHQSGALVVVPYGNVVGNLDTTLMDVRGKDSGMGDVMLGFIYGLYGSPSLTMNEYKQYDPGFAMTVLSRLTLPTGSYDSDQNLNMGGNRWLFELGTPISYYFGESFLDPSLMSVEIFPKVTFFAKNDDAVGSADRLEQDPLFSVEAHLTRNFNQAVWASLDMLYEYGGETTTDGVSNDNKMRSLSVGATAAMYLSESTSIRLSYGEVVSGNVSGSDGKVIRAQLVLLF